MTSRDGPLSVEAFKVAAGTFPSGVTVVAARYRDQTLAKTVSAFASLSLRPPLVGVAIGRDSPLVWAARVSGGFTVSVLRADQDAISDYFAAPAHRRTAPPPAEMAPVRGGGVALSDCLSWFDCDLAAVPTAGDHTVLIGQVREVEVRGGPPLLHHASAYHGLGEAHTRTEKADHD